MWPGLCSGEGCGWHWIQVAGALSSPRGWGPPWGLSLPHPEEGAFSCPVCAGIFRSPSAEWCPAPGSQPELGAADAGFYASY